MNLAVTALLGVWLLDDLHGRDVARRRSEQERERQLFAWFEQVFDDNLSVALEDDDKSVARAIQLLRHHPIYALVRDGVIWQEPRAGPFRESARASDAVPSSDALFLNVPGAKHRAASYDVRRAKRQMAEALRSGRIVRETDPELRGWVAAPIRVAPRLGERRGDAPLWGAGYFLLDVIVEPPWQASFQPRTLLLGMGLGTLLLLAFTWFLLDRSVLRPLAELTGGAARVAARRYDEPVPGGGGDEIGKVVATFNEMMGQVRDGERRLTEKVDEATRRAEERGRGLVIAQRLAATGTLASGIAHEINNPLGGMLNVALKLKAEAEREPAAAGRVRYLKLLVDGLVRIQEIVKRVLHFTPRRVEPQVVPVLELVRRATAFADHNARRAGVELRLEGEDAPVLVEAGEMQQVFLNLLLNAIDAIAGHSRTGGHVTVRARVDGGRVVVELADDGPGMTQEQQERCFDLFFTTKEVGKGTGLGLSVAHHLIEQHGGQLSVRSAPGEGAVFTVSLPLAPSA